ncbi:Capsule polysaccharide biosynthesis protein [Lachnospiraceae bacterium XBD2001]|nr:Capsule polysaccharide biosynthesis protein [Lachnospiraceae bacterium XBD2001]
MKKNLLTCWFYGVNNKPFEFFLDEFDIEKCHCITIDKESNVCDDRIVMLNISNSLEHYQNANIVYELDDKIVDLMKPYEQTCLDLINRWRRSYTYKSDYQEIKNLYFIFLRYWNDYILKNNINLMVVNTMPHVVDEIMPYAICRAYGIPTIIQGVIPFRNGAKTNYILRPNAIEFDLNSRNRYLEAKQKYSASNESIDVIPELEAYFEQYDPTAKGNQKVIYYNEKNSIISKLNDYRLRAAKYIDRGDTKVLTNKVKYMLKVKTETARFLRQVESLEDKADTNRKYMLFCLHLQPEATTTPAGGNYADQLMAIRLISQCLPDDMYLYVKEHPAYWTQKNRLESVYESRSIEFYQNIKKLRNVVLVDHKVSSGELMNKCSAVVTINGTVGFEALFKGIPVMTFAATFFEQFPYAFRVRTKEDCQKAINEILNNSFDYNRREVEILLSSVQKYVVPMGMFEKNFLDNGAPAVSDDDRMCLINKIMEFYKEYYED